MNYDFPVINNYSDVEPYIDDYFIVKEKNGVRFINYKNMSPETFPPVVDYGTAVRREFRGIAFDVESGKVLSRPFHKFFNINERPETENIDFGEYHWVDEKLDGSMVRPIRHPSGAIRWCTKAGITDVALQAEVFVANNPKYQKFVEDYLDYGCTPIFEYIGPNNKIVLDYDQEAMVLLAIRDNKNGKYMDVPSEFSTDWGIPNAAPVDYPEENQEGTEGVVITFLDGHKVKVKTEWYVLRHKGKELIENERKVVGMILDNTLDDVLPLVSEEQRNVLRRFEVNLLYDINKLQMNLDVMKQFIFDEYKTRKDYAISCNGKFKWFDRYVFMKYDGKNVDPMEFVREHVKKNLTTQTKYEDMKKQLGLPTLEKVV